ncbi:hypothetical protein ACTXT7_000970 [Hymenolepis weldensis]
MYVTFKIKHDCLIIILINRSTASSAAARTVKDTYGNDVVSKKTCRRWLSAGGFKKDDFSLKDERRIKSRMLKKTRF